VVNLTFNQNITPKLINAIVLNFTRTRSNRINGFANNVNEEALLELWADPPTHLISVYQLLVSITTTVAFLQRI